MVLTYLSVVCASVLMAVLKSGRQIGCDEVRKALRGFRALGGLVCHAVVGLRHGREAAFASGLALTLVEFIACMVMYRLCRGDDLTSRVRLV